jgi:rhodanese-related sulfurtransferase
MKLETEPMDLRKMYFQAKLAAEKQKSDVVKKVKTGQGDFVLLDARDRASFDKEHLPGALSVPLEELDRIAGTLDRGKEYVTYCWTDT